MTIDFYYAAASPPCLTVNLAAAILGLELNKINIEGDTARQDLLKVNPQHTVPTIVDDGLAIGESRSIIRYFANKYGKNTSLYPEDPKARAIVDQRLDFDLGTLYPRLINSFTAPGEEAPKKKMVEALEFLETFLKESKYAAGSELTLADLALSIAISIYEVAGIDIKPYSNIVKWHELVRSTAPKYEEATREGFEALKAYVAKRHSKTSDE